MKGRRPKPLAIHKLHGTLRKDRHSKGTTASGKPAMPAHLDEIAQAEFKRVCREMAKLGTLARADAATIAAHSATYSRWVAAESAIVESGIIVRTTSGDAKVSPWVKVAQDSVSLLRQYAIELGLSPSSRTRLKPNPPETHDRLQEMLAARNSKWSGLLAGS